MAAGIVAAAGIAEIAAGIGAALLPDWQEILNADELTLIPLEDNSLMKDIGLAFNCNKENSSIIAAVKEICRSLVSTE